MNHPMHTEHCARIRPRPASSALAILAAMLLAALALPAWSATRPFSAQKSADPTGTVEVVNVAGSIDISGWDRPEVDVSGTIGDRVERVDVTSSANRTTVRVVLPRGDHLAGDGTARLKIRVPQASALDVSLVSADLRIAGVSGNQKLQTVSGDIRGQAGGELQVSTVSGDVQLDAHGARSGQFRSVSGDLDIGGLDGDLTVNTVSGDVRLALGALTRARIESVSGDVQLGATSLAADGQIDVSSISGEINARLARMPDADIEVRSFSGEIRNCFGPKPTVPEYGPGSRLDFRSGKGGGRVHIDTKSGDVELCAGN